jgi:hypothetical protein
VRYEDPQVLRIRKAWLRPDVKADTNPAIETRGDDVYISFPHLNLILVLDQWFYADTLKGLLTNLVAVPTVKEGHVFLKYIRSRIEYRLERLVVARTEDYWSVKLRRDAQTAPGKVTAPVVLDYRASNIIVEKSAEDRADEGRLTKQREKNLAEPTRKVYLGHHELLLAEPVPDEHGEETGETILDSVDISQPRQFDENVFALINELEDNNRACALSLLKVERPDDYRWFLEYTVSRRKGETVGLKDRSRALSIRRWLKRQVETK